MIIIGIFEHSIELEQALAVVENDFVPRDQIMLVFMDNKKPSPFPELGNLRDMTTNAVELGMACATGCAVIGACIGFVLTWGPIIWGLLGALIGFGFGFGLYYVLKKGKSLSSSSSKNPEVTVMIQCKENQSDDIKHVLWKYQALAVGQVNEPPNKQSPTF